MPDVYHSILAFASWSLGTFGATGAASTAVAMMFAASAACAASAAAVDLGHHGDHNGRCTVSLTLVSCVLNITVGTVQMPSKCSRARRARVQVESLGVERLRSPPVVASSNRDEQRPGNVASCVHPLAISSINKCLSNCGLILQSSRSSMIYAEKLGAETPSQ